jgi:nucleotide-binding universal stress UspA family protein
MIKRILLPLDASPFTAAATEAACVLARNQDAQITGLVVLDIPGIKKSIGPVPLGGGHYAKRLEGSRLEEAEKVVDELLATFRAKCEAEGVPWQEAETQGTPHEQISDESVYYDALVMGLRTFYRFDPEGKPGDTLDNVLEHSVTPVMGVPESYVTPEPGARVKSLLLFDGSLPAARSLQRFAQMARPELTDATLVMAGPDEELANYQLERAAHYLAAHGFDEVRSEWTEDDIVEAVDERYLDAADLVVVGAHSKVAVIDFLIGSLARHLIEVARKPILIGQ